MARLLKRFVVYAAEATIWEDQYKRGNREYSRKIVRIQQRQMGKRGDRQTKTGFWAANQSFLEMAARKAFDFLALREYEQLTGRKWRKP